jgi:uncharacterized protein (DUF433 family)
VPHSALVRYYAPEVLNMPRETDDVEDRIIQDPDILVGKPVVRGTRIPVELVLAKLAANPDVNELFQDYPRLSLQDIEACLRYAARLVQRQKKATKPVRPAV